MFFLVLHRRKLLSDIRHCVKHCPVYHGTMTSRLHEQSTIVDGIEHCANYDPEHIACRQCPGKAIVRQSSGQVDIICRAGEAAIRKIVRELPQVQMA